MPYARFSQIIETIGRASKREAREALLQQSLAFAVGFGGMPLTEAVGIYDDSPEAETVTAEEAISKAENILKKYAQRREAVVNG